MPNPCVASTSSVNLTVNGAPGTLYADVKLSTAPSRLLIESGGLRVRDINFRVIRITNGASMTGGGTTYSLLFDGIDYASTGVDTSGLLGATGLYTAVTAGIWHFDAGFVTDGSSNVGARSLFQLVLNGAARAAFARPIVSGDANYIGSVSCDIALAAGDQVGLTYGNYDTAHYLPASPLNYFSGHYVGPGA